VIRANFIAHENLVGIFPSSAITGFSDHAIVEVSDDQKWRNQPERTFAVYRKNKGVIIELIESGLRKRNDFKNMSTVAKKMSLALAAELKNSTDAERRVQLASEIRAQKGLAKKFNSLQLLQKAKNNAIYGSVGSRTSPVFNYVLAASVTAGARFALQMANLTVHQSLGTITGEEFATNRLLMDKVDATVEELNEDGEVVMDTITIGAGTKKERTKEVPRKVIGHQWTRNMFNSVGNRVLQNDTDSAFFTMMGTTMEQVLQNNKESFPLAFANMSTIMRNRLNANLATQGQSNFQKLTVDELIGGKAVPDQNQGPLEMECEELIVAVFTSQAKKSYVRLDAVKIERKDRTI
jgi:DNA polymerase elongation subunit (family B)